MDADRARHASGGNRMSNQSDIPSCIAYSTSVGVCLIIWGSELVSSTCQRPRPNSMGQECLFSFAIKDWRTQQITILLGASNLQDYGHIPEADNASVGSRKFEEHYQYFIKSSVAFFPSCRTVPNHHYAYHIPEQLLYWGPLMRLSEFAFERQNGLLQRLNTNSHPGKRISDPICSVMTIPEVDTRLHSRYGLYAA